ncbi:hypothetical protein [Brachybacterium sacelli]|uniref:FtsK domain-containing protein n=1 Tax=Brachybacterium sacelli TaxID=173364 RepID=A0ABS4X5Q7_9MICO|nr:hypothetical protein [Brachybacterium sacelli]MBP2383701.1 hypothetical protein [Brachybacterium sacelli]
MPSTSDKKHARAVMDRHEGVKYTEALRFVTQLKEMRERIESRAAFGMDPIIEWDPKDPAWKNEEMRRFFALDESGTAGLDANPQPEKLDPLRTAVRGRIVDSATAKAHLEEQQKSLDDQAYVILDEWHELRGGVGAKVIEDAARRLREDAWHKQDLEKLRSSMLLQSPEDLGTEDMGPMILGAPAPGHGKRMDLLQRSLKARWASSTVTVGRDVDRDLPAMFVPLRNALVAGSAGSGATVACRMIAASALDQGFNLSIVDPKTPGEYAGIARRGHSRVKQLRDASSQSPTHAEVVAFVRSIEPGSARRPRLVIFDSILEHVVPTRSGGDADPDEVLPDPGRAGWLAHLFDLMEDPHTGVVLRAQQLRPSGAPKGMLERIGVRILMGTAATLHLATVFDVAGRATGDLPTPPPFGDARIRGEGLLWDGSTFRRFRVPWIAREEGSARQGL